MELRSLGQARVLASAAADVGITRERVRLRRLRRLAMVLTPLTLWLLWRAVMDPAAGPGLPHLPAGMAPYLPGFLLVVLLGVAMVVPLAGAGRSPHVLYRPAEIDTRFSDVRGAEVVLEEVVKSLNLFLAHQTFADRMGGTPRRAILFEGPPGTGKTFMAKAMAAEAGVPFLFVSSSAFQSMYYGQTNRKIRSYFKALRRYARREGGAIGFIEEIDAIGATRAGLGNGGGREGVAGVVNELLVQLQSFDHPSGPARVRGWMIDWINSWLPVQRQLHKAASAPANVLVIAATNRAADLDPALLRPGRFDRTVYFDLPSRAGRREIIDYYLGRKAHEAELDDAGRRDTLAAITFGYSPAMIEHLLDEALVWALRRGADRLSWTDLQQAKMTEEIGLPQPVEYSESERRTIATHESGHATVAWLVGRGRKLDVLSIIKRKEALGLLAHSEEEERFTRTRSEMDALVQIAFGGLVAEELFFGEHGSGVAGDLQVATRAVCQMVGSLGMGRSLVSAEAVSGPGRANVVAEVLSTDTGREEVEGCLAHARARVHRMLQDNRHVVEALRDALLERDELIGEDILEVIQQAAARPAVDAGGVGGFSVDAEGVEQEGQDEGLVPPGVVPA
ncbi:MAG: AAA family ATPase [Acidimicrobiales bacterium]